MRFLDTREQKSPRFLEREFDTIPGTLPAGDWLFGAYYPDGFIGVGIEFKLSLSDQQNGDYGIHTEPIERFHDECANKIKPWMIKNPGCDFHAIWWVEREVSNHEKELWDHFCYQYYLWGHVVHTKEAFIQCIKDIEGGTKYVRDQPFIKRSHEEPTILAKMLRQFPWISSVNAIHLASAIKNMIFPLKLPKGVKIVLYHCFESIFGTKNNKTHHDITIKFMNWIETGAEP